MPKNASIGLAAIAVAMALLLWLLEPGAPTGPEPAPASAHTTQASPAPQLCAGEPPAQRAEAPAALQPEPAAPARVRREDGARIAGRVVDEAGAPVPRALFETHASYNKRAGLHPPTPLPGS